MISARMLQNVENHLYDLIAHCATLRRGEQDCREYRILAETEAGLHELVKHFDRQKKEGT